MDRLDPNLTGAQALRVLAHEAERRATALEAGLPPLEEQATYLRDQAAREREAAARWNATADQLEQPSVSFDRMPDVTMLGAVPGEHVDVCCDLHKPGVTILPVRAECCDPNDCGPCCPDCPTCPTLARARDDATKNPGVVGFVYCHKGCGTVISTADLSAALAAGIPLWEAVEGDVGTVWQHTTCPPLSAEIDAAGPAT